MQLRGHWNLLLCNGNPLLSENECHFLGTQSDGWVFTYLSFYFTLTCLSPRSHFPMSGTDSIYNTLPGLVPTLLSFWPISGNAYKPGVHCTLYGQCHSGRFGRKFYLLQGVAGLWNYLLNSHVLSTSRNCPSPRSTQKVREHGAKGRGQKPLL